MGKAPVWLCAHHQTPLQPYTEKSLPASPPQHPLLFSKQSIVLIPKNPTEFQHFCQRKVPPVLQPHFFPFAVPLSAPDALKIITENDHILLFWKSLALKESNFNESRVSFAVPPVLQKILGQSQCKAPFTDSEIHPVLVSPPEKLTKIPVMAEALRLIDAISHLLGTQLPC